MSRLRSLQVGMDWFPYEAGGLNRYFHGAVHALPAVGVTGTAVVIEAHSGDTAPMRLRGMAPPGASLRQQWRGVRRIVRESMQEGIDVVNPHFAKFAYPWVRSIPENVPIVMHFHGPWADEMQVETPDLVNRGRILMARHMERVVYRRATRSITLSDSFREVLVDRFRISRDSVHVVSGGLDLDPFLAAPPRAAARSQLGWPADRPILLAVRRLTRRMGLEMLLEAMETVRLQHPTCLLLLAGKGPIRNELAARIAQCKLKENVRLLGFIPESDLPAAYAAADMTLVPTVALEGFGLITVESLASGTPVLGTPVGGTREILQGLHPDCLFDAPTPEALADRLDAVLAGRLNLPDRDACRAYAEKFGWARIAPRLRDVYMDDCLI